jgi:hypothetical protein
MRIGRHPETEQERLEIIKSVCREANKLAVQLVPWMRVEVHKDAEVAVDPISTSIVTLLQCISSTIASSKDTVRTVKVASSYIRLQGFHASADDLDNILNNMIDHMKAREQ